MSPDEQVKADAFFDADDFAQIIDLSDLAPKCCWGDCTEAATHVMRCRACSELTVLICTEHAIQIPGNVRPAVHKECGTTLPLCDLMEAVRL